MESSSIPPQSDPQPEQPQSPVDQAPSSTAPSEDTGGSSPEQAAPAASVDPSRPFAGATNPKTAAPPPPGVPTEPVNATRDERVPPAATRPASRIGEAIERKEDQREESLGG